MQGGGGEYISLIKELVWYYFERILLFRCAKVKDFFQLLEQGLFDFVCR